MKVRSLRRLGVVAGIAALLTMGTGMSATLPPANGKFDYQLGGAYAPEPDVAIVVRDRLDAPVPGKYNICYVNAFQTQPGDTAWWKANHPTLLVKKNGKYLVDANWPGELLLDTSTAAKRQALAGIVGTWIDRCARDGFSAVEPDNLDSWTRSKNVLKKSHNVSFAKLLAQRAHSTGLAIAQKNAAELAPVGVSGIGFDFAIVEECEVWSECDDYISTYGNRIYEIEYSDNDRNAEGEPVDPLSFFVSACSARGSRVSVIYRDRNVVTPANTEEYVYQSC
jgi:hypothetical protein